MPSFSTITPCRSTWLPWKGLIGELERVGPALGLATDDDGLARIAAKYADDDSCDDDMEVQAYAQLLLAARQAIARRQPLWVVK